MSGAKLQLPSTRLQTRGGTVLILHFIRG